ncbi:MAG: winged helix-turn-helix transcriptional regulator [Dongiaceae bacterium]
MSLPIRKSRAPLPPPACPLTECMALLGGAWTPNVIWHLSAGPRRFSELRIDMPRISAKVLTARLRQLERRGVVERHVRPTSRHRSNTRSARSAGSFFPPSMPSSRSA